MTQGTVMATPEMTDGAKLRVPRFQLEMLRTLYFDQFDNAENGVSARAEFEMTQADLDEILKACKPVPYIIANGIGPSSPQENANRAWAELGARMGFDHMTVRPVPGKGDRFFTAEPRA